MAESSTNLSNILNQMPVISPDGTPGTMPREDWANAEQWNAQHPEKPFKRALFATDPNGKLGVLHPEDAATAVQKYHFTIGPPEVTPSQPGMLDTANQFYQSNPNDSLLTRIAKGLGRVATMPANVGAALVTPPSPEERQQGFGTASMLGPLQANRLLVEPSIKAAEHVDEMAAAQKARDLAAGHPNRLKTRSAELAGKAMAMVPILGPMGLSMGEQAAKGDVAGTVAEGVGYSVAPEVVEKAKPVISSKVVQPSMELARGAGRELVNRTPAGIAKYLPESLLTPEKQVAVDVRQAGQRASNLAAAAETGARAPKSVRAYEDVAQPILDDVRAEAASQGKTKADFEGRKGYESARQVSAGVREKYDTAYKNLVDPVRGEYAGNTAVAAAQEVVQKMVGDAQLMDEIQRGDPTGRNVQALQNIANVIAEARTVGQLDDARIALNRLAARYEGKLPGQQYLSPLTQETMHEGANAIRNGLYEDLAQRYGDRISEQQIRDLQHNHGAAIELDNLMQQTAQRLSSEASKSSALPTYWQRIRGGAAPLEIAGRPQMAATAFLRSVLGLHPPDPVEVFNTQMRRVIEGAQPGEGTQFPQLPITPEYVEPRSEGPTSSRVPPLGLRGEPPTAPAQEMPFWLPRQKGLPPATRIYGVPEEPIVDVPNTQIGNDVLENQPAGTVTPLGPTGKAGVLKRPFFLKGKVEAAHVQPESASLPVQPGENLPRPEAAKEVVPKAAQEVASKVPEPSPAPAKGAEPTKLIEISGDIGTRYVPANDWQDIAAEIESGATDLATAHLSDSDAYDGKVTSARLVDKAPAKGAKPPTPAVPKSELPVTKVEQATSKEPWQMTRDEFVEAFKRNDPTFRLRTTTGEFVNPETKGWGWLVDARHKQFVKSAVMAGDPVPQNVLADYPDLKKYMSPSQLREVIAQPKSQEAKIDELVAQNKRIDADPAVQAARADLKAFKAKHGEGLQYLGKDTSAAKLFRARLTTLEDKVADAVANVGKSQEKGISHGEEVRRQEGQGGKVEAKPKLSTQQINDIEDKMARGGGISPKTSKTKEPAAPVPSLEQRALASGAQKLEPKEAVPQKGKNFEGRYVQAALEPAKQAWDTKKTYADHTISWQKDTDYNRRNGLAVNMHAPNGDFVAQLEVRKVGDKFIVRAKGNVSNSKYFTEVAQNLDSVGDFATAKKIAEDRLRTGQVYDPASTWVPANGVGADYKPSEVSPRSKIEPDTSKPAEFKADKLLVKVPKDGTFVVPNRPDAINRAMKAAENFTPEKEPASAARRVPKSPPDYDVEKHIVQLEKEVADLQDQIKKAGDLQKPYLEEQLKAAYENLAEAKKVTPSKHFLTKLTAKSEPAVPSEPEAPESPKAAIPAVAAAIDRMKEKLAEAEAKKAEAEEIGNSGGRRDRLERKVEKRQEWAAGRQAKVEAAYKANEKYHGDVAFNTQPGHIPERARAIRRTERAFEDMKMAEHHTSKAAGLQDQLDHAVYSDDANAVQALEARIAQHEAERTKMTLVNKLYKKGDVEGLKELGVDYEATKKRLAEAGPYWGSAPHLPYEMQNLGGRIRADKQRLEVIKRDQARKAEAEASPTGVALKQHGGGYVSVTFAEKPDRKILDALRNAGFRWGGGSWTGTGEKLPQEVKDLLSKE